MPLIKARTRRIPMTRHICRLTLTNRDVLVAYARMIDDTPDYVLNQLIERYLSTDRDFHVWREQHGAARMTSAATPTLPAGTPEATTTPKVAASTKG